MRALLLTALMAAPGCLIPCGGGSCGPADPIRSEMLTVDLYEDEIAEDLERTEVMISGDLEIADDAVILVYTDVDGNTFQVTWERPSSN